MSEQSKDGYSRRNILGLGLAGAATLAIPTKVQAQPITSAKVEEKHLAAIPEIIAKPTKSDLLLKKPQLNPEIFKRSNKEQVKWFETRDKILKNLKITSDGTATGTLTSFATQIQSGFVFKSEASDDDFSSFHIEPLIDQAADLLDRGMRDRSEFDDLSVKMFNLALELNEYAELDVIHLEEEAKGIYDVNRLQSIYEYEAEQAFARANDFHKININNIINEYYSKPRMEEIFQASRQLAFISSLPPYQLESVKATHYQAHQYPGVPAKTSFQFATDIADIQWKNKLPLEKSLLELQAAFQARLVNVADNRAAGLKARTDWDLNNSGFMKRRTKVARKYQDIKAKSVKELDGILNYEKRTESLRKRFHADFRNAKARLLVIEKGLSEIYGYKPKPEEELPKDEKSVDYFDKCLLWTRNTIQWLIRFSRMDQSMVLPISIHEILGEDGFNNSRNTGKWIFELPNKSIEEFLKDMCYVRLRGISVCTVKTNPTDPDRIWQARIIPPRTAKIRYFSDWRKEPLDQSKVPPCLVARVTERNLQKDADIVGASSLYNASPLGKWAVQFFNPIPSTSNFNEIKDVQLELHLAFRYSKDFKNITEDNL